MMVEAGAGGSMRTVGIRAGVWRTLPHGLQGSHGPACERGCQAKVDRRLSVARRANWVRGVRVENGRTRRAGRPSTRWAIARRSRWLDACRGLHHASRARPNRGRSHAAASLDPPPFGHGRLPSAVEPFPMTWNQPKVEANARTHQEQLLYSVALEHLVPRRIVTSSGSAEGARAGGWGRRPGGRCLRSG